MIIYPEPATQDEINNAKLMGEVAEKHNVDFVLLPGYNELLYTTIYLTLNIFTHMQR